MLEYEWGNPSTVMLTGDDEPGPDSDHSRQIFDHYAAQAFNDTLLHPSSSSFAQTHHHPHSFHQPPTHSNSYHQAQAQFHAQTQAHYHSLYASYPPPSPAGMLSLDPTTAGAGPSGFFTGPKSEPGCGVVEFGSRIGLNLGGRTYFSSAEDDFVNRLYRRSRPGEPGSVSSPRCQAEGCSADLTHAKHYHRRHKVCEFHSKAATVVAAGLTQRFCQQCSRFHVLSEFDNGKRSCRKRLADHNRRRRKSHQPNNHEAKSHLENARSSPSDNQIPRSPADSGPHSSSAVTVAISPPRISLDCFRQRSYQAAASSSPSTSSLFFSNG